MTKVIAVNSRITRKGDKAVDELQVFKVDITPEEIKRILLSRESKEEE